MALSISLIDTSCSSVAQVTHFFFLPFLPRLIWGGVLADAAGGVDRAGESFRAFIDLSASWKGSNDEGKATLLSSFLSWAGTAAFLNEGSLALGFGAEKNEKSALASLTAATGFVSFFTTAGFIDIAVPMATLFCGAGFDCVASLSFLFLDFGSIHQRYSI